MVLGPVLIICKKFCKEKKIIKVLKLNWLKSKTDKYYFYVN